MAKSNRNESLQKFHLLTEVALTMHYNLRKSLMRMGLSDTDYYRFCGEEEKTSIHLVAECPAIAS